MRSAGAALVTGAARRLGRAMALSLAERGFDVAVHYAGSREAAEQTARDARAFGVQAVTLGADLLNASEQEGLVPRAIEALQRPLSVLINNASIFEYDTLEGATRESWDRHMESNLRAPFVLTQAFAAQAPKATSDQGASRCRRAASST